MAHGHAKILAEQAGGWVGYYGHDLGVQPALVDALRSLPGAEQWVGLGQQRRAAGGGGGTQCTQPAGAALMVRRSKGPASLTASAEGYTGVTEIEPASVTLMRYAVPFGERVTTPSRSHASLYCRPASPSDCAF